VKFGVAFCEASGARLVRRTGNDDSLVDLAVTAAMAAGRGGAGVIDGERLLGVETEQDVTPSDELRHL